MHKIGFDKEATMKQALTFGTDGIRGPANQSPFDDDTLTRLGRACVGLCTESSRTVVIARDTRSSGTRIQQALTDGLMAGGAHVIDCGVLPTAALACIVVDEHACLGLMITASHNPWQDNGVKFFSSAGKKLPKHIQAQLLGWCSTAPNKTGLPGQSSQHPNPTHSWKQRLPQCDLSGWTLLLDCAHGSLSAYGAEILAERGATIILRGASPDGQNINHGVGALHPPADIGKADLALCFDGDADRIQMVDRNGRLLDGDDFLVQMSKHIPGPLVGTIMSNGGLQDVLGERLLRSAVGDANVAAEMEQSGAIVGAEPSGHVIFNSDMPAGDGMYAALRILETCPQPPMNIEWKRWPSAATNVRFRGNRIALEQLSSISLAEAAGHRLVVRYSGTEPKLRILVEGANAEHWSTLIADEFRQQLSRRTHEKY